MTATTDLTVTIDSITDAATAIVTAQIQVDTGNDLAQQRYIGVQKGYKPLAELVIKGKADGLTTAQIADALTESKLEGRKWQPSEIAHWEIAKQVMDKAKGGEAIQIAAIPQPWQGDRTYKGDIPQYDDKGLPVRDDKGKVVTKTTIGLLPLIRQACDHSSVPNVRSVVATAADAKAAVAGIEAIFHTPKPPLTQDKVLRGIRNRTAKAVGMVDKGDTTKSAGYITEIEGLLTKIKGAL